jgi:hypothetical protein
MKYPAKKDDTRRKPAMIDEKKVKNCLAGSLLSIKYDKAKIAAIIAAALFARIKKVRAARDPIEKSKRISVLNEILFFIEPKLPFLKR